MTSAAARCSTPRLSPLGAWSRVSPDDVRTELRRAFARWGLPRTLRVDNGTPWGSHGDFPTDLSLWVLGLGIAMHRDNPRSPEEDGVVERSRGTSNRWCAPWTCATPEELQERLRRMDRPYRESSPYRDRLSRRDYFPALTHSGRSYDPARESEQWQWSHVAGHLASCVVTRQVDSAGPVSLYNRCRYVGRIHRGKPVYVMYDPNRHEWIFAAADGRQLRSMPADELSRQSVMDLKGSHRKWRSKEQ